MERSRLTRDGTAGTVSRNQILRRERGQGNIYFPCLADHEQQDWQPCPDPSLANIYNIHTYIHVMPIHTYIMLMTLLVRQHIKQSSSL